jgi:repressor LexA
MTPQEIRERADAIGLSLKELADRVGMNYNHLVKSLAPPWRRLKVDEMDAIRSLLLGADSPATNVREIPVYGRVPGSSAREMEEEVIGATFVSNDLPKEAFALEVVGGSMDLIAPEATDVIVNPKDTGFWNNDLYVIRDSEGGVTFKRYVDNPARLVPCSSDLSHEEIILGPRPINVVGKVIQVNIGLAHLRKMALGSR